MICLTLRHNISVLQTDGQTDRRTDRNGKTISRSACYAFWRAINILASSLNAARSVGHLKETYNQLLWINTYIYMLGSSVRQVVIRARSISTCSVWTGYFTCFFPKVRSCKLCHRPKHGTVFMLQGYMADLLETRWPTHVSTPNLVARGQIVWA